MVKFNFRKAFIGSLACCFYACLVFAPLHQDFSITVQDFQEYIELLKTQRKETLIKNDGSVQISRRFDNGVAFYDFPDEGLAKLTIFAKLTFDDGLLSDIQGDFISLPDGDFWVIDNPEEYCVDFIKRRYE